MTDESRGRDSDREEPLELARDDKRKLYAMLDANLPPRMSRIELALAVVVPSNLALLWKVFGSPTPQATAAALIDLIPH